MLQIIINGQSTFRQEVQGEIKDLKEMVSKVDQKIDRVEENLTKRMDKIGKQLAYLEDDAPTREVFNNLEKRIGEVEQKVSSTSPTNHI